MLSVSSSPYFLAQVADIFSQETWNAIFFVCVACPILFLLATLFHSRQLKKRASWTIGYYIAWGILYGSFWLFGESIFLVFVGAILLLCGLMLDFALVFVWW
jgi:hypothetical protein